MKKIFGVKTLGVMAVAMLLVGAMIAPASADHPQQGVGDHCPGANPGAPAVPAGHSILLDNDATEGLSQSERNDHVPDEGELVCIKTGGDSPQATGIFEVDDSGRTLQEWLLHFGHDDGSGVQGRNVSYYMTYEGPEDEPETQTIVLTKIWEGDDFEGSGDVEVTFDVLIDDEPVTLGDGEESGPFDAEAEWSFVGENVSGFPDDDCDYESTVDEEAGTVTNVVTCDEDEEIVTEVLPEVETEVAPEVVEVLEEHLEAVEEEAEELPTTGASALLLALMGLFSIGTGGALLRRRR